MTRESMAGSAMTLDAKGANLQGPTIEVFAGALVSIMAAMVKLND